MTRSDLVTKTCAECESGSALAPAATADLLKQVPGWEIADGTLRRQFKFKDYHEAVAFVNATAWISHHENHHPDIELGYNRVTMKYVTHSAGGLTQNDFICAAKVNTLVDAKA